MSKAKTLAATVSTGGALEDPTAIPMANISGLSSALAAKQDTLVSGTNIKTINGGSILGSGDLVITGFTNGKAYFFGNM